MPIALDVCYGDTKVRAALVGFDQAVDAVPRFELCQEFEGAAPDYEPGNFKKRELPYLEALVRAAQARGSALGAILINCYVWLGPKHPNLNAHLYEAFDRRCPVIGVAKTKFSGAPAVEVLRGHSKNPLYVTAIGVSVEEAQALVLSMHGEHRLPTLLRRVDQLSRGLVVARAEPQ